MVLKGTKSRQVRSKIIQKIIELLDEWKSDQEIMKQLKIPHMTYYRYKSQIYEQDKELLSNRRTNEMAHRTEQIRKSYEYCIKINKDICETSADDRARSEASKIIVQAQTGLRNLLLEPPYHEQVRLTVREVTEDTKKLSDTI